MSSKRSPRSDIWSDLELESKYRCVTTAESQETPHASSDWSWQLRGHCLTVPSEIFFPEDHASRRARREREEQAKRICRTCPVLSTCREHALTTPERFGVWGATTARERQHAAHS